MNSLEAGGSDTLGRCGADIVGRLETRHYDSRLRSLVVEVGRPFPAFESDVGPGHGYLIPCHEEKTYLSVGIHGTRKGLCQPVESHRLEDLIKRRCLVGPSQKFFTNPRTLT